MNVVLLVYIMLVSDHKPPDYPTFFTVYKTERQCKENAERYMSLNGTMNILINAKCANSRTPELVPYLRNVPEVLHQSTNNTPLEEEI